MQTIWLNLGIFWVARATSRLFSIDHQYIIPRNVSSLHHIDYFSYVPNINLQQARNTTLVASPYSLFAGDDDIPYIHVLSFV